MAYDAKVDGDVLTATAYNGNLEHGYWGAAIYDADVGGDDTYIATLDPAPSAYTNGMTFRLKPTTANTGAATVNINALGEKDIKKNVSDALETGDIKAGQIILLVYNGTAFELFTRPNTATSAVKGVASFSTDNFLVTTGDVTVKDDGIQAEEISGLTGTGAVDTDNIPEGSTNLYVTAGTVNTTALKTATGSQSGTGVVSVTMNDYSFFPATSGENAIVEGSSKSGTIGNFISNGGAFAIAWRYVNASDKEHWIYALEEDGVVTSIWEAEDHCPVEGFNPFGELKENQKCYVIEDDAMMMLDIRKERKKSRKSLANILFEKYEKDVEIEWKERHIVEEDEFDEKVGDKYIPNYDAFKAKLQKLYPDEYSEEFLKIVINQQDTPLKYIKVDKLPDDIGFAKLKKKG